MAGKTRQVADYRHEDATRLNNPTAALAREDVAPVPKRRFEFDPHVAPELVWAGKAEEPEIEVDAPSIHVHERLSTDAILKTAQQENAQVALFADPELERAKQIEFYEHEMGWANRLILGDSLVVMASLLERERMGGKAQLVYIDPPYGIDYNSNFQARLSNRSPKESADSTLTREPEQIQAYRDTWQLGIHSYLTYLRQRLMAARELLNESGSVFVQIGDDNSHHVRQLLDEVFGTRNCVAEIAMQKSGSAATSHVPRILDYIHWYAKDIDQLKFRPLYEPFDIRFLDTANYKYVEDQSGDRREMTAEEKRNPASIASDLRPFQLVTATSQDPSETRSGVYRFRDRDHWPDKQQGKKRHWSVGASGMDQLASLDRLEVSGETLRVVRYLDDFPIALLRNVWLDTGRSGYGDEQRFVVQTNSKAIERCILMATDPGDLVIDPTCGSGTTAFVSEKQGRRWVTTDTSRVALAIARERLLTAKLEYYRLSDPTRGVDGGFEYDFVNRIRPSDLAYSRDPETVPMRTAPRVTRNTVRVSGPFTVEALSRYADNPFHGQVDEVVAPDAAAAHVTALLDALRTMGIPRRGVEPAEVVTLDPLPGTGIIHAEGTYCDASGEEAPFAVSLGPRHGPITVAQVDEALHEAPGYRLLVFAGFAATSEAQDYLAPGRRGRVDVALLEANADLLLGDLLKNTSSSQTFRLFAAPEATVHPNSGGDVTVEILGMDSFDAATGEVLSRNREEIAAWFLDHDYDGSVFHVNQAFFTRSDAWEALGKALRGTIDQEVVETMHSFTSLPFEPGPAGKAAIRVVDDAGQTSEAILDLKG